MNHRVRVTTHGDSALSIAISAPTTAEVRQLIRTLRERLVLHQPAGVTEIVPGSTTITVHYDPLAIDVDAARDGILTALTLDAGSGPSLAPREHTIPVRYDGPDLDQVAETLGLSRSQVIGLHSSQVYEVTLMGFVPGFGYLSSLPATLVLPRRATPRTRVPAGSVAIAGTQTAIYPAETPGGWHLIGRTTSKMFDPDREPPNLLSVGDRVRFTVSE